MDMLLKKGTSSQEEPRAGSLRGIPEGGTVILDDTPTSVIVSEPFQWDKMWR